MELLIEVNDDNYNKLKRVSDIIKDSVNVEISVDELCSKAVNGFLETNNHIEVLKLTPKIKLSVAEVLKHGIVGDFERDCIEYLCSSKFRNQQIKSKVGILITELQMMGEISVVDGRNMIIDNIQTILIKEFDYRYKNDKFKSGFKKYAIKIALMNLVFSESSM